MGCNLQSVEWSVNPLFQEGVLKKAAANFTYKELGYAPYIT